MVLETREQMVAAARKALGEVNITRDDYAGFRKKNPKFELPSVSEISKLFGTFGDFKKKWLNGALKKASPSLVGEEYPEIDGMSEEDVEKDLEEEAEEAEVVEGEPTVEIAISTVAKVPPKPDINDRWFGINTKSEGKYSDDEFKFLKLLNEFKTQKAVDYPPAIAIFRLARKFLMEGMRPT